MTAVVAPVGPALPDAADVVVVGAGHNGLVCAAYLAAAGLDVLVLEAREVVGGNTVTEELTLSGFAHDSCSSAHVLIQSNPLIADDELGLLASYGLEYTFTDPAVVLPQPDGDALVMHRDLEGTVEEIARRSVVDAVAFRELISQWSAGLAGVHGRWNSGLPLGDDDATRRYLDLRGRSAWAAASSSACRSMPRIRIEPESGWRSRIISRSRVDAPGFVRFWSARSRAVFTISRRVPNSVRRYVLSRSQRATCTASPGYHTPAAAASTTRASSRSVARLRTL